MEKTIDCWMFAPHINYKLVQDDDGFAVIFKGPYDEHWGELPHQLAVNALGHRIVALKELQK
jgi:hypothetical protein